MKYYLKFLIVFLKVIAVFAAIRVSFSLMNTKSFLFNGLGLLLFLTALFFAIYQLYLTIKKPL